ncbi:enoyl-CoA hydratase/isomerase family protein [Bacillus sp. HMF5848]|uniref:enoyl-CoA hydratase/isomerase family protein n=1 Tax=Bacillus sp. HMF5848 TaxID=2495421 RepID=UPI000F785331|nr:enoyl-CoA hydratase/isomerase family protein [Bacillus sp. HMF5848]RSK26926.1 enoyl-CoA hydratase/isomerase family protein [Bacillus sp. HMF5848]
MSTISSIDSQGVLWFTINRREKRNAINYEVMEALEATIKDAETNDQIKAVVLTGTGEEAFCSGGDLSIFHNLITESQAYDMLLRMGRILYKLLLLPKPTIALLNGTALGGGCELATACDYRFATSTSKIGFIQGRLAITTGWGAATMLMEKLPYEKALYLLTSSKVLSSIEAQQLGFVEQVMDKEYIEDELQKFLKPLVEQHANVIQAYKQVVTRKWEQIKLWDRMEEEIRMCAKLWEAPAHHEAVQLFLNKKQS